MRMGLHSFMTSIIRQLHFHIIARLQLSDDTGHKRVESHSHKDKSG